MFLARIAIVLLLVLFAATLRPLPAGAQVDEFLAKAQAIMALFQQGKTEDAIKASDELVAFAATHIGQGSREHGHALVQKGTVLFAAGQANAGEQSLKDGVAIFEQVLAPDDLMLGGAMQILAAHYHSQGRLADGDKLMRRVVPIFEKAFGKDSPVVTIMRDSLASRGADPRPAAGFAELEAANIKMYNDMVATFGESHPQTAVSRASLGLFYVQHNRCDLAFAYFEAAIKVLEVESWTTGWSIAMPLDGLADCHEKQGRLDLSEPLRRRSLAAFHAASLADSNLLAGAHLKLGKLLMARAGYGDARTELAAAAAIAGRRSAARTAFAARDGTGNDSMFSELHALRIKTAWALAGSSPKERRNLAAEAFEAVQGLADGGVARAVGLMSARVGASNPALAAAVRQGQDLVARWQGVDKELVAAMAVAAGGAVQPEVDRLRREAAGIDRQMDDLNRRLLREFPAYVALVSRKPLAASAVQALLTADEAMLVIDNADGDVFAWLVTRNGLAWRKIDLTEAALGTAVQTLRCGLDATAWYGNREAQCQAQTGSKFTANDAYAGRPLPYDLEAAHALYRALVAAFAADIGGKHVLIVASGQLSSLPLHVLVSRKPATRWLADAAAGSVSWFGASHAISVLPAVASLQALRQSARPSRAKAAMIGFGNPLLDGEPGDAGHRVLAERARAAQRCPPRSPVRLARGTRAVRAMTPIAGSGLVDKAVLKRLLPLPETRDELCAVADSLDAGADDVKLGAAASESAIKSLSAAGRLADYRIVHFATHGALAGEVTGSGEPGLVLTPPETATEADDGYLSASEIAALRLDADMIVLSACNTAGAERPGAEPLSGLAKAFFYAGARSMLVSHWAVDSNATVKLVTTAIAGTRGDPRIGRAEGLRRAMAELISNGDSRERHPASWAPFVIVGEGGVAAPASRAAAAGGKAARPAATAIANPPKTAQPSGIGDGRTATPDR